MRSQFDNPVDSDPTSGTLQACGPLEWEGDETKAEISVIVTQRDGKVMATGSGSFDRSANDSEWMIPLTPTPANGQFNQGTASASGALCAMGDDDGPNVFNWSEYVDVKVK